MIGLFIDGAGWLILSSSDLVNVALLSLFLVPWESARPPEKLGLGSDSQDPMDLKAKIAG